MAPGKNSCGTCNLNNSPKRCFSSSPFPLNHPAAARQTTRGAPAAAELGEMKVGLILPTHARQPGWARSKHGTAGSAKVASVSDSSAFCYHGVTGLGREDLASIVAWLPKQEKGSRHGTIRLCLCKPPGFQGKRGVGSPASRLHAGQNLHQHPQNMLLADTCGACPAQLSCFMSLLPFLSRLLERVTSHS